MGQEEVERRIREALDTFMRDDDYLLVHNLSERCIASRLALHLQGSFTGYKVDVEYNRAGDLAKRDENDCAGFPRAVAPQAHRDRATGSCRD